LNSTVFTEKNLLWENKIRTPKQLAFRILLHTSGMSQSNEANPSVWVVWPF
jgi:hypothetical protein